ncbi:MAG: class I SAM-dependent methyltransferase [Lentisphaeria bacterium]
MTAPAWQWNEDQQIGTDYANVAEVRAYDRRMGELRDIPAENRAILALLQLAPGAAVLEIGTGTGAFAREAARAGHRVTALDISPVMLDYAAERAREDGLAGIRFVRAGFLTYEHAGEPFDAVVSGLALHHLPDLWKFHALKRIHGWLRPGGRFLLQDVVFDPGPEGFAAYFDRLAAAVPTDSRQPFIRHIRQEYSTLAWILEGLLQRSGFTVEQSWRQPDFMAHYLCRAR